MINGGFKLDFQFFLKMEQKKLEIKEYISSTINVFIEPLVYSMVKARPANPVTFAIEWLKDYAKQQERKEQSDSEGEEQKEDVAILEAKIQKKKMQGKSKSRMAISEQAFGIFNKKQSVVLTEIPKSAETELLIKSLIRNSILFQNLDWKDEETLVKAMSEKTFESGDVVIKEGEAGDELFIVQSGQYECSKLIDQTETYLKTYVHGQAFGELALMYNAPRAATIICKTPGKLYKLDRGVFSQVVKEASAKKRELFKKVIESIDIFSSMTEHNKQQFLDILKEEKFEEGQYVIEQGEQGNKFYIVMQGELVAEKSSELSQQPNVVYNYKENDYFGEIALIHDVKRQASIKAVTKVRLASLDRDSFKRIFGNLEEILKKNEERYQLKEKELMCA